MSSLNPTSPRRPTSLSRRPRTIAIFGVFALGILPACGAALDREEDVGEEDEVQLRADAVRWIAHTVDDGDAFGDEGFTGVYDLGVEFEVDRAWWVHYSAALIPCEDATGPSARRGLPGIRAAKAGHDDVPDGSTLATPVATALSPGRSFHLGDASFAEQRYCAVHLLAARADEATINLDMAPHLLDATVSLDGRYRLPASDAWVEFSCATDAPIGAILPLRSTWLSPTASNEGTAWDITVTRALATVLDGVDPSTSTEDACGRVVLANLFSDDAIQLSFAPTP
jgi:hypothetical protein